MIKQIGIKDKYQYIAETMNTILLINKFEFVEGGINDRYRVKSGIVLKRFWKLNNVKENEFVREFWFYTLQEAKQTIKTLSFYIYEAMYTKINNELNKVLKFHDFEFDHDLVIIQPPCQIPYSWNSTIPYKLDCNVWVESMHMYACNSYYSLLSKLMSQNLTYQYNNTDDLPISKTLVELFLGEEGLFNVIEDLNYTQSLPKHKLWDLDEQKSK